MAIEIKGVHINTTRTGDDLLFKSPIYQTKLFLPYLELCDNSIIKFNGEEILFSSFKETNKKLINDQMLDNITIKSYEYKGIIISIRINSRNTQEITHIVIKLKELMHESMSNPIDHVIDNVHIGNMYASIEKTILDKWNIGHIVQILDNWDPVFDKEINYLIIPIDDKPDVDISQFFAQFEKFIENHKNSNKNILIHCQHGSSRSGSFVIYYLMHFHKMSFTKALNFAREKRFCINPNDGFRTQLEKYC